MFDKIREKDGNVYYAITREGTTDGASQVFGHVASTHCYQSGKKMKDGIYLRKKM